MGTLTYVRHGQARPFEKDSDQLSATGEEQARALGEHWARRGVSFDEVYSGLLVRQVRTAEIVGQCLTAAGLPWPQPQAMAEFNEYDANGITGSLIPALAERDAEYRALFAAYEANRHGPDRNRHFQKMFEVVVSAWQGGELEMDEVESWSAFRHRVRNGLKQIITTPGSGRRVAVFTSGGVIGTTVQTVLDAPERQALTINWRVKNCSLTEFTFGGGRISLDSFNSVAHLEELGLVTFR